MFLQDALNFIHNYDDEEINLLPDLSKYLFYPSSSAYRSFTIAEKMIMLQEIKKRGFNLRLHIPILTESERVDYDLRQLDIINAAVQYLDYFLDQEPDDSSDGEISVSRFLNKKVKQVYCKDILIWFEDVSFDENLLRSFLEVEPERRRHVLVEKYLEDNKEEFLAGSLVYVSSDDLEERTFGYFLQKLESQIGEYKVRCYNRTVYWELYKRELSDTYRAKREALEGELKEVIEAIDYRKLGYLLRKPINWLNHMEHVFEVKTESQRKNYLWKDVRSDQTLFPSMPRFEPDERTLGERIESLV